MFTVLAEYVLAKGGYVCGAAFDKENGFRVRHIIINNAEELGLLRGSKYVQSDMGDCFAEIKKLLESGSSVLFTGTPCQCAGLKGYLKKDYEKLLIADLVCHGVPSPLAFDKYLKENCEIDHIAEFKFRTKAAGYTCTNLEIIDKQGESELRPLEIDPYEKCFHQSIALRRCCYDCRYAAIPRQGDFTLGDFWGISKFNKDLNDGKGTTLLLVNNQKAADLLEKVREQIKLIEEVPIEVALENNSFGSKRNKPAARDRFFGLFDLGYSFNKAADYALKEKYDIGVIGLWFGENYGSILTYYGLNQVLKNKLGLSVLMINNPLGNAKTFPNAYPEKFGARYYNISPVLPLRRLSELNRQCDAFLVGSDQLWNYWLSKRYGQTYFLDFADNSKKKIAYGTSFGGDNYNGPIKDKFVSLENFKHFDHISVREDSGIGVFKNTFGMDVVKVCDPVFLCDTDAFAELADKNEIEYKPESYVFAYILDPTPEKRDVLRAAAKKFGKKVVVFLDEPMKIFEENKARFEFSPEDEENIIVKATVHADVWLKHLKDSAFVITDSYHGCCFASLFKRSFVVMKNHKRGGGRFHSTLSMFALEDRIAEQPGDIMTNEDKFFGSVDYKDYDTYLAKTREFSFNWLKNAIFSPKVVKSMVVYPTIDKRLEDEKNKE